ncbi:MAG TPA: ABC transporter permease [Candidatus Onthovicinus excrementipullorum]|nr:ABC transporter permease [Candidatus Onthovicinus excrementipullorum]
MTFQLELKKLKRTGFFPAILGGGLIAAAFPILNTAARPEMFISQPLPALDILMNANSQMIVMLNLCLAVIGACMIYHTEFSGNAMQKMESLPVSVGKLFFDKTAILLIALFAALLIEHMALAFCALYWFPEQSGLFTALLKNLEYSFALLIPPCIILMIFSSLCRNMWITLGAGVICIFTVSVLPTDNRILSFFPFSLPFQTLAGAEDANWIFVTLAGCAAEIVLAVLAEAVILKVRRHCA